MEELLLKENTIIILDTNIYLDIYRYSPDVREQYFKIIMNKKIIKKLYLTKTILFELEKNRTKVMKGTVNKFENKVKSIKNINIVSSLEKKLVDMKRLGFPNIEKLKEDLKKVNEDIDAIFENYLENHQDTLEMLDNNLKDLDMVKDIMDTIIDENRVIDGFDIKDLYKIVEEGENRFKKKIAPGYGDEKDKQGLYKYNDLIIWKEIIKFCKETKKNLIYITGDKKEWDQVTESQKKEFPKNMLNEFKKQTLQDMIGVNFEEFIESFCISEGIPKPNGLNYIMQLRGSEDVENIQDEIVEKIESTIIDSGENYVDTNTLSNYDGSYFEISEVEKIELLNSTIKVEGCTIEYFLNFGIKVKGESRNYLGKDEGEIIYSDKRFHLLQGNVRVCLVREIEYYLEIDDIELDNVDIQIDSLEEYDAYSEENLCVSCGKGEAIYKFNGKGLICEDCMVSDGEGDVCPRCGEKYYYDDMAGDGFCRECSNEID